MQDTDELCEHKSSKYFSDKYLYSLLGLYDSGYIKIVAKIYTLQKTFIGNVYCHFVPKSISFLFFKRPLCDRKKKKIFPSYN